MSFPLRPHPFAVIGIGVMLALGLLVVAAIAFAIVGKTIQSRTLAWAKRAAVVTVFLPLGSLSLLAGFAKGWADSGAPPEPFRRSLSQGIELSRNVRREGAPLVWHVAKVDLSAGGLNVVVSSGDPARLLPLEAKSTSQFAKSVHADVAMAADFFMPSSGFGVLDTVREGEALTTIGFAASKGNVYAKGPNAAQTPTTFYFSETNTLSIGTPVGSVYNAVSGDCFLLRDGQPQDVSACAEAQVRFPRSLLGTDAAKKTLYMMVVDGDRASQSVGVTAQEFAELAAHEGIDTAIECLIGSGATMAGRLPQGDYGTFSTPVAGGIPSRENAAANHIGIVVESLGTSAHL